MILKLSIITNRRGFLKEKKVRFCLHDMVKYGKILNVESGRQPQIRITAPDAAKPPSAGLNMQGEELDKIKFVMTDTGAQTTQLCRQALEAKGIDVTVCEKNGSQALKSLLEEHPQAVLLDAFMPDLDAITVKQRYETQDTRGGHTTFFVTGAFQSEEVEQDLLDNGFSFFFVKPFDENVLVSRVLKAAGSTSRPQPVSQDCDELTVTEILHQVGVPAHIKGYQFLRDAILLAVSDHDYINAVTKRLYPEIAKRNATTASRVERAIRHAIEVAWDRGDVDTLNSYFGYTIHNLRGKPTNSEFIAMISDKIRLDKKQRRA